MHWWHVTLKDLKLQLRDRRSLAVLLLLPLIFISIIGLSTGRLLGWRAENQIIRVAWADRSGSELAKRLQQKLEDREEIQVVECDEPKAKQRVSSGECALALIIGPEFQERVDELQLRDFFARKRGRGRLAGGLPSLDIAVETKAAWRWISNMVTDSLFSLTLEDVFPEVARKHNLGRVLIRNMEEAAAEEDLERDRPPLAAVSEAKPDSRRASAAIYDRFVPGFTVMFAFFLVNVMARSFIAERECGTLRRLRLAPITPSGLLIGKTLPYLVISLIQSVALFLCGRVLFDMTWGQQPWLLLPILVSTSLAATSLGLLIATSVRTDSQVSSYSNLIVISLAGVSGCFVPRDWMPELMKTLSLATPHAWSLIGYSEVLANPQPQMSVVVRSCTMLLTFAVVFFVVGHRRFRGLT